MSTEHGHCNVQLWHVKLSWNLSPWSGGVRDPERQRKSSGVGQRVDFVVWSDKPLHSNCFSGAQWAPVSWALALYRESQAREGMTEGEGFRWQLRNVFSAPSLLWFPAAVMWGMHGLERQDLECDSSGTNLANVIWNLRLSKGSLVHWNIPSLPSTCIRAVCVLGEPICLSKSRHKFKSAIKTLMFL